MNKKMFIQYQNLGFTRIPVSCQIIADLETPLSIYLKLAAQPKTFLFESMQGGEKWGRYSIIGLPSQRHIEVRGTTLSVFSESRLQQEVEVADPLAWIESFQSQYVVPEIEGLPRITGGLVGYFAYDTVRYIETRLGKNERPDPIGTPDILLMICHEICVYDNITGSLHLIVLADAAEPAAYENALARLEVLKLQLHGSLPPAEDSRNGARRETEFVSGFEQAPFKQAVSRVRQLIQNGDCMQVVLSQRLSATFDARPIDLYRALRRLNPSPYMFFLDLGDHQIVGSSPEILVRLEQGEVTVRPLAGTRPRGATEADDRHLETELLADEKELAEHLMLIDLGRNDVGRVAETGSVSVTDKMCIERYSHVMHIVSNVVGKLKSGLKAVDVLRAAFPAGTLSGAPKVRAMEIIQELEPVKRGIYGGSIGYLSWNGNMDTSIAIRTAVIKQGRVHVQAGAGIVYDSDPDAEWDETINKAKALCKAVEMAHAGIDNFESQAVINETPSADKFHGKRL